MNIALEKTDEYVNGQLRRNYGDAFVRGNNGILYRLSRRISAKLILLLVMYISADP